MQREHAYDLGVAPPEGPAESSAVELQPEPNVTPSTATATPAAQLSGGRTLMSNRTLVLNEPYLDIRGSREVHIEGILDYDGLIELEETLKALKMLIKKKASAWQSSEGNNAKPE